MACFHVEDFWKRAILELQEKFIQCDINSIKRLSFLNQNLFIFVLKLRLYKLLPAFLYLQILLVLMSKTCWLISEMIFSNRYMRRLLVAFLLLYCVNPDRDFYVRQELPEGEWFCSNDCTKIHFALQKLVSHGPESLPSFITDELMKKRRDNGLEEVSSANISWQLLHAKTGDPDSRVLLLEAAAIFAECFDPIIDTVTGRDLIPSMVYSKSMKAQDFRGMYCAVLTADSVVISAAVFRIFGRQVAELPLVATSPRSQGQGYFQSLFSCIERLLGFLNVENLVLPTAEEAESIWISKFGFTEMSEDKFDEYRKDLQIMSFQGNSKLEKPCSRFSSVCGAPDKGL